MKALVCIISVVALCVMISYVTRDLFANLFAGMVFGYVGTSVYLAWSQK